MSHIHGHVNSRAHQEEEERLINIVMHAHIKEGTHMCVQVACSLSITLMRSHAAHIGHVRLWFHMHDRDITYNHEKKNMKTMMFMQML